MINGVAEPWTFGYLFETILTRDTWMHRIDTAEATGRPLVLTAEHDGVLVADVVAEWAARHGAPFTLQPDRARRRSLVGRVRAARSWSSTPCCSSGPLSGRETGTGLLAIQVPF